MGRVAIWIMITAVLADLLKSVPAQAVQPAPPVPKQHATAVVGMLAVPKRGLTAVLVAQGFPAGQDSAAFKYRLIVVGSSDTLLRQVRRIVPDAFRTWVDGRRMIQAGLFVTEAEAEAIRAQLEEVRAEKRVLTIESGELGASGTATARSAPDRLAPGRLTPDRPEAFQYRLVVVGSSDTLLRQVRRIVPDAFRTFVAGRRMIQAGLFVTEAEAEAVQQQLENIDAEKRLLAVEPGTVEPGTGLSLSPTPPLPEGQTDGEYQYRLIVQGSSETLLRQVRQIVPDAFRIVLDNRRVIQAGLFVKRQEAEAVERQLARIDSVKSILGIREGVVTSVRSSSGSLPRRRSGGTVVVVDPGHGGRDPGAVGINGIHEADIVLDIAVEVSALLEEQGIQAILTRSDDREVELEPRVDVSDRVAADLFVSIHANAISLSRPDVNGLETYYYSSTAAEQLAETIHDSVLNATDMKDRGVRQARFYVLTETSMPAVLVEVGFVTGREDAARLSSTSSRRQIAAAIAQGILRYIQRR